MNSFQVSTELHLGFMLYLGQPDAQERVWRIFCCLSYRVHMNLRALGMIDHR